VYKRIQPFWVIYCSLFLLAGYTHGLQLATGNLYEARVHVFIYGQTWSLQSELKYRCLSSTIIKSALKILEGEKKSTMEDNLFSKRE
jgi:hypothetical protein